MTKKHGSSPKKSKASSKRNADKSVGGKEPSKLVKIVKKNIAAPRKVKRLSPMSVASKEKKKGHVLQALPDSKTGKKLPKTFEKPGKKVAKPVKVEPSPATLVPQRKKQVKRSSVKPVNPSLALPAKRAMTEVTKPLDAFDFSESGSSESPCEPLYILDSFSEATGPRYRKISLNGMPKPDGKPQSKAETDEEKEETYVDALDLSLRHDTSDVYIPLVGDSLPFAIKRSVAAELFTTNPSLPLSEMVNRPFGHGWTSGLTASVQFTYKTPPTPSDCPSEREDPDYTFVTDETGAVFRFLNIWNGDSPAFMPIPTSFNEQENFLASLIVLNPADPQNEWQFQFTKKYGTTLLFSSPIIFQSYVTSGLSPDRKFQFYSWCRLLKITDRYGNKLTFNGDETSLLPTSIETEDGRAISITRSTDGLRVMQIQDPLGNIISYTYNTVTLEDVFIVTQLVSVQRPENQTITYAYSYDYVEDNTPRTRPIPPPFVWYYCRYNLASITDANNNTHAFVYQADTSMEYYSGMIGWYTPTGVVRIVAAVALPNGLSSTFIQSTTDPIRLEYYDVETPTLSGFRTVMVGDSSGNQRTYIFDMGQLTDSNEFVDLMVPPGGVETRYYFLIRWQRMQLIHPTGVTETFIFNPFASMALASVVDYSGNTTVYEYADAWSAASLFPWMPSYLVDNPIFYSHYGDPTSQTDALGQTKSFEYEDLPTILRIMTQITDELNRITSYGINPVNGLRTSETITAPGSGVVKSTLFVYTDPTYAAFMTEKAIVNGTTGGDLVTTYESDSHGYVAQENVGGISLTKYTHDANGNRTSVTDPNNNVTYFAYDGLNRLVRVTNPDSTTRELSYDPAGNKISETDENGHVIVYSYDQLNRLTQKQRVMGATLVKTGNSTASSTAISGLGATTGLTVGMAVFGRGIPLGATVATIGLSSVTLSVASTETLASVSLTFASLSSTVDLITKYAYNGVNSKTSETDPNNNTTYYAYDSIQRLIQITDALEQVWLHDFSGPNTGASAFNSSDFKPTQITDPRGFRTWFIYDALYRTTSKNVEYEVTG